MDIIAGLLNLPWTFVGMIIALLSIPRSIYFQQPTAIVVVVRSFWWQSWLKGRKGVRAMSIGSIVILGPHLLRNDLAHELIHVEQYRRRPFVQAFLYSYQALRYGYRANKYEVEAYERARNKYVE